MTPRSFLFVTWAGGGNVPPLVVLGRRLADRGHAVRVFGPAELEARFKAEGIGFSAHGAGTEWTDDFVDEMQAETARVPTDAVLIDYMQPHALCAAERAGLPRLALVHTLYASVAAGPFSPMTMMGDVTWLNALRGRLDLSPVVAITDLLDDADGVIVTTVPELDQPAGAVPANVRYIGPLIEDAGPDAGWRPAVSGVPLVVVSLGTTPMGEAPVVQRVLDALADEPVQAVATIGDHLDAGTFTVPSNATIVPYVRHAALFPHARVVVSHAGLGTVSAALIHGVPLVCIPLGRDQPANAAHVEAAGAGYTVASTASTDELTSTIMAATADAPVTAAAREMGDVMARYENGGRAVLEVEQLLTRLAE